MRWAPASRTASATAGLNVSTDTRTPGQAATTARTTGTTLPASWSGSAGGRPVIADCAPTSSARAPFATMARARSTTASTERAPGSEKESELAFTMPMTRCRSQENVWSLIRSRPTTT